MVSDATQQAFYEGPRSDRFPLSVNDVVTVADGKRVGARAWVIQIEAEDPEPKYLIEYDDGSDEIVPLSRLQWESPNKGI